MTTIIDGKKISTKVLDRLEQELLNLDGAKPHLVVVFVGNDSASELYVGMKKKMAQKLGMDSTVITYPQDVQEEVVLAKIQELNSDENVDAILVQLPLPKQISEPKVIQSISPQKDVDGFTPENIGRISIGVEPYAYPCTPKGIMTLFDEYGIELEGKHAVVIGRSNIVGKPMAQLLLNKNATVTICHSKTKNLSEITKTADILISAVGEYKLIRREMVKSGAVIIDVGTSKFNGKTCGDVDFENLLDKVSFITPVPGGVGPMTIASLMQNTYNLFKLRRK